MAKKLRYKEGEEEFDRRGRSLGNVNTINFVRYVLNYKEVNPQTGQPKFLDFDGIAKRITIRRKIDKLEKEIKSMSKEKKEKPIWINLEDQEAKDLKEMAEKTLWPQDTEDIFEFMTDVKKLVD